MAFRYVYNSSGGDPVIESFLLAAVTTAKGSICYYDSSGYLTNAYTNASTVTTVLLAGVTDDAVVNAAGAAGDLAQAIVCTRDARYIADTTAAPAQTDIGTNVTLDSILIVDENDSVTDSTGTVRLLKRVGTLGTTTQVLCSLNYGTP